MRRRVWIAPLGVALVAAIGVCQSSALAVSWTVKNPSFENPGKPNIRQDAQTVPYGAAIPDWAFQCDGAAGQNDRDVATYPLSNGALPGGDGDLIGFFNHGAPGQIAQAFTNVDTPSGYQPNMTYTLTVALGNASFQNNGTPNYRDPGMYRLQFYTQQLHTLLASSPNIYASATLPAGAAPGSIAGDIPDGALKDFTFTFTTPADFVPMAGNEAVRIQIQAESFEAGQQSTFDNVRLDISPAPEPASLAALALGGMVLGRRRK